MAFDEENPPSYDGFMTIESLQNQTVKKLVRLKNHKDRTETGRFLAEGPHLIEEAWQAGLLEKVFVRLGNLAPEDCPVPVEYCSQAVLNKISSQKSDALCIGLCKMPAYTFRPAAKKTLLLDGVQDPGNVGTLIRSACAFGADQVVLSGQCADPYSPKVIQSTQGALFHIPCVTMPLEEAIEPLKQNETPVYGAALHTDSINLQDLAVPSQYGLIIGSEGKGIRPEILNLCTQTLFIEMKQFESLNAAIAGSILLYAFQFPKAKR